MSENICSFFQWRSSVCSVYTLGSYTWFGTQMDRDTNTDLAICLELEVVLKKPHTWIMTLASKTEKKSTKISLGIMSCKNAIHNLVFNDNIKIAIPCRSEQSPRDAC